VLVNRQEADSGAIAIMVAVLSLVLFGFGALVVDLGMARDHKRQAQAASDSASLAGAGFLARAEGSDAQLVARVKDFADTAYGVSAAEWQGCTDGGALTKKPDASSHSNSCISYDKSTKLVRVVMPGRQQPSFFAGVLGVENARVGASAVATWDNSTNASCVVCILGNYDGQNGTLSAPNGGIAVNGTVGQNPQGVIQGNGVFFACNSAVAPPNPPPCSPSKGSVTPAPDSIAKFADPFASLWLPGDSGLAPAGSTWPTLGSPVLPDAAAVGTCSPDVYRSVSRCTRFLPGTYVIVGDAKLAGQGNVAASSGVLFYMGCEHNKKVKNKDPDDFRWEVCDAGEAGGSISEAGGATYTISGLTSGPYKGFVVIFDRHNTQTWTTVGGSGSSLSGSVYGVNVTVVAKGTPGGTTVSGVLVVKSVSFSGQDTLHVTGGAGISLPGIPAPPHLVE
jgi:hypothetical protein